MKTKAESVIYRQGDVAVIRIDGTPPKTGSRVKRDAAGRVILAAGELTGHHHAITSRDATLYEIAGEADRLLRVRRPVDLTHEEHGAHRLAPGNYRVRIQRTYQRGEVRNVAD